MPPRFQRFIMNQRIVYSGITIDYKKFRESSSLRYQSQLFRAVFI